MRAPSFLLGFTAAASLFGGSLAGPCRVSSSTTATPTSITSTSTPSSTTATPTPTSVTSTSTSSSSTSTTSTTSSTTSTTSTGAATFTAVAGNSAASINGKLLHYSSASNGQPIYIAAEGGLSNLPAYRIGPLTLEPITNRLMVGSIYPYARPSTSDSFVYTGTATYIDSSAGTTYAAAYFQCSTPVPGNALQCTLEGSTKTQFRVQINTDGTGTLVVGDPNVASSNTNLDLIVS